MVPVQVRELSGTPASARAVLDAGGPDGDAAGGARAPGTHAEPRDCRAVLLLPPRVQRLHDAHGRSAAGASFMGHSWQCTS